MAALKFWIIDGVNGFFLVAVYVMNLTSTEGLLWPEGLYGLPKPRDGCPKTTSVIWETGVLYQDCEDTNPTSSKSPSYNLAGFVTNDVQREFCIKNSTADDIARPPWPTGQYCIYQKGDNCPSGLDSGWVIWDDESENNKNEHNGTLPRGLYNNNTKIYFCCSTKGNKRLAIDVPVSSPFYLIAFGSDLCQLVRGATVAREFIYYETEHYTMSSKNDYGGVHPYRATRSRYGHTIYYCYYTPKYCPPFVNSTNGIIYPPRCSQTNQNVFNDTCTVQCKRGFAPRASNSTKSTCKEDGSWDLGILADCIPSSTTTPPQARSTLTTKVFNDTAHSISTLSTTRHGQRHSNGVTTTLSTVNLTYKENAFTQAVSGETMSSAGRTIAGSICGAVVALGVILVIFVAHCRSEKAKKDSETSGLTVKSKLSLEELDSGSNININRRRESSESLICTNPGRNEVQYFVKTDDNPLYERAGPEESS